MPESIRRPIRLATLFAATAFAVGWFLLLRPTSLGGPAGYAMVTGPSMEPSFQTGDLVITERADSYAVGDIVLFRVKNALVIHRIVGGDPVTGYATRGDNNRVEDGFRPTIDAIDGKAWLRLPGVGQVIVLIRQPLPLAICTWIFASVFLVGRWAKPTARSAADQAALTDG